MHYVRTVVAFVCLSFLYFVADVTSPFSCPLPQTGGDAEGGGGEREGARLFRLEPPGQRLREGFLRRPGQVKCRQTAPLTSGSAPHV